MEEAVVLALVGTRQMSFLCKYTSAASSTVGCMEFQHSWFSSCPLPLSPPQASRRSLAVEAFSDYATTCGVFHQDACLVLSSTHKKVISTRPRILGSATSEDARLGSLTRPLR